jgi:hypothetical protein
MQAYVNLSFSSMMDWLIVSYHRWWRVSGGTGRRLPSRAPRKDGALAGAPTLYLIDEQEGTRAPWRRLQGILYLVDEQEGTRAPWRRLQGIQGPQTPAAGKGRRDNAGCREAATTLLVVGMGVTMLAAGTAVTPPGERGRDAAWGSR